MEKDESENNNHVSGTQPSIGSCQTSQEVSSINAHMVSVSGERLTRG